MTPWSPKLIPLTPTSRLPSPYLDSMILKKAVFLLFLIFQFRKTAITLYKNMQNDYFFFSDLSTRYATSENSLNVTLFN